MSRKLLLFGFEELPTILAAAAAAGPFGAEVVPVARQDYNKPLAVLAGLDDDPGTVLPFNGGPLGGRMVVLCGLEDQVDCLLPALRQAGIGRDCLKAVLTPHNRTWTAVKLYQELLRTDGDQDVPLRQIRDPGLELGDPVVPTAGPQQTGRD